MKSRAMVVPKPAMMPKIVSAVAAPRPETKPYVGPSKRVRRTHSTPTGPTGNAMTMPTATPLSRAISSVPDIDHQALATRARQSRRRRQHAQRPIVAHAEATLPMHRGGYAVATEDAMSDDKDEPLAQVKRKLVESK